MLTTTATTCTELAAGLPLPLTTACLHALQASPHALPLAIAGAVAGAMALATVASGWLLR